jgi:hypothetical protein
LRTWYRPSIVPAAEAVVTSREASRPGWGSVKGAG